MINRSTLVSVIIPVYDVRPYLSEALDSVLNQTYKNLEIIIVDDGSTDGSAEICDYYSKDDERITVFHQENRGLSSARNTGLDVLSGEYVAFLDSDDAYHPEFIGVMVESLIRNNADLAVSGYKICDSITTLGEACKGRVRPLIKAGTYDRIAALNAFVDGTINVSAWNKVYKSELWDDIRFPDGYVYEDNATIYKIMNNCKSVCIVNRTLMYYRIRPGSITDAKLMNSISDLDYSFSSFEGFIRNNIPDIFTKEQWRRKRQSRLNRMLFCYVWDTNRDKDELVGLRNQIIQLGDEVGIDQLKAKNMCLYETIKYVPWFIEITSPIYHYIRNYGRRARRRREMKQVV